MKTCSKCNQSKELEEFQKRSINKDGRSTTCKVCKREYDNAHYASNPDRRGYIRANSDKRIETVRQWLYEYLASNPCIDCGEPDLVVLEFDHRGDKVADIALLSKTGNLSTVQAEVAKCDIRCANCHRRKTAKDFGSWRLSYSKTE